MFSLELYKYPVKLSIIFKIITLRLAAFGLIYTNIIPPNFKTYYFERSYWVSWYLSICTCVTSISSFVLNQLQYGRKSCHI